MVDNEMKLGEGWRIVTGAAKASEEGIAAEDLQLFLQRRFSLEIGIVSEDEATGTNEIVIGTPQTCNLVKKACDDRKLKITAAYPGPEGFQLKAVDGCIFACGFDPVGAMYGVFCLEDRIADHELMASLDLVRKPFFKERSCGAQWVQQLPPHCAEEELAAWVAHRHFNLYGPIIQPWYPNATLSDRVAEKYGIHSSICVEPPRPTMEFMKAYPEYVECDRRGAVQWGPSPTMCFRCDETPRILSEWIQGIVKKNPRALQLTMYFGDLACICADQCPRCGQIPYPARAIEVLDFLNKEAQKLNPKVKLIGQTWLLHGEGEVRQIIEQAPPGLGIQMNEPAAAEKVEVPGFGAQDNWLVTGELDEIFGPLYLQAGKLRQEDFYPLMSIGDSCESVDPVIGMQLPWTVARKMRRAAEHGMVNLCVWWGVHPWVYSSNYEVIREMVFDPFQDIDALIARIARRDFGEKAHEKVLETWRLVEEAMESWKPKVSWAERLEEYTGRCTRHAFFIPLTESIMEQDWSQRSNDWTLSMSKSDKIDWWAYRNLHVLVPVRRKICGKLGEAVEQAQQAHALTTGQGKVKSGQQLNWLKLLYCLFLSQYHYFKTLEFEKSGMGDEEAREEWLEVVGGEIKNCERVLGLMDDLGGEISNISGLSKEIFEDRLKLTLKIKQMRYDLRPENIERTLHHKVRRMKDILSLCPCD